MLSRSTLCASLFLAALAVPASAAPILTASQSGMPLGPYYANFNNLPLGGAGGVTNPDITVSFTGDAKVVTGFLSGQYAAPYVNGNGLPFGDPTTGPDLTRYLSTGIGSVTLAFTLPQTYLGVLWGSADLYDTLSLDDGSTLIASFTGADVNAAANGDQGINGSYYVNISNLNPFTKAVFTSSSYAFEFDNVSYNVDPPGAVPEPLTLSLFAAGLLGLTMMTRRRKLALASI